MAEKLVAERARFVRLTNSGDTHRLGQRRVRGLLAMPVVVAVVVADVSVASPALRRWRRMLLLLLRQGSGHCDCCWRGVAWGVALVPVARGPPGARLDGIPGGSFRTWGGSGAFGLAVELTARPWLTSGRRRSGRQLSAACD